MNYRQTSRLYLYLPYYYMIWVVKCLPTVGRANFLNFLKQSFHQDCVHLGLAATHVRTCISMLPTSWWIKSFANICHCLVLGFFVFHLWNPLVVVLSCTGSVATISPADSEQTRTQNKQAWLTKLEIHMTHMTWLDHCKIHGFLGQAPPRQIKQGIGPESKACKIQRNASIPNGPMARGWVQWIN